MRTRHLAAALLFAFTGACSPALAQHADALPTARDVAAMDRVGSPALSPDGRWVAWDLTTYRRDDDAKPAESDTDAGWKREQHIWIAPADSSAPPRRLTFSEERSHSPQFSPDGRTLAFVRSIDGKARIHLLPLSGGEASVLDTGDLDPGAFRFNPDGKYIAFTSTPEPDEAQAEASWRAGGGFDWEDQWTNSRLYVISTLGGEAITLTDDTRNVNDFTWAPDGTSLAIISSASSDPYEVFNRNSVQIVDATGAGIVDGFEDEPTAIAGVRFSPDGARLAYTLTRGTLSVHNQLVVRDLTNGEVTNAAAALDPTLGAFVWTGNNALVAHAQEKTRSRLYRLPIDGSRADALTFVGRVIGGDLSPSANGRTVATLSSTMLDAPTPTVIDLTAGGYEVIANINPQVDDWSGFRTEVVTWDGPEGATLEGVLAVTPHAKPGVPPPLMVMPHGGPDSVTQESFSSRVHYFTARGFSVFCPNYRGGTAYGHDFYAANRGRLGEIEFMDIESGVDALIDAGKADPHRLVYGGWSWGGYLTAWTIGHTNRYRAAVAGAAVTDVVAQYVGSDINHGVAAQWEYTGLPWTETNEFDESDPIRYLKGCTTPTLIIHGQSDDRVPFSQGLTLYRALVDLEVDTRLLAYPREPHGFREPAHIEHMLNAWSQWYLDRVSVD